MPVKQSGELDSQISRFYVNMSDLINGLHALSFPVTSDCSSLLSLFQVAHEKKTKILKRPLKRCCKVHCEVTVAQAAKELNHGIQNKE